MCRTFGCYLKIMSHFSQFELNQFLPKHKGTRYLVNATPSTILPGSFLNFAAVFVYV